MSTTECSVRDLAWLARAARIAENVDGRSRHGAVIVNGGRLIGWGVNRSRTHNRWYTDRARGVCSIHAEVQALRHAGRGDGAVIYVARINRCGVLRNSAPCISCYRTLELAGIKRVVHT